MPDYVILTDSSADLSAEMVRAPELYHPGGDL